MSTGHFLHASSSLPLLLVDQIFRNAPNFSVWGIFYFVTFRHIETNQNLTIESTENVQEWIQWAKSKADWYDPTVEKKDEFLSQYGEFHEALLEGKKEIDGYNLSKL